MLKYLLLQQFVHFLDFLKVHYQLLWNFIKNTWFLEPDSQMTLEETPYESVNNKEMINNA